MSDSFPLSSVLNSLKESYDQALRRDDVKAIVVTGIAEKFESSSFFGVEITHSSVG